VKKLVLKATQNGDIESDEFTKGLLELRNTPRADGRSPLKFYSATLSDQQFRHIIVHSLPSGRSW